MSVQMLFQLLTCDDSLLFFVRYDRNIRVFIFRRLAGLSKVTINLSTFNEADVVFKEKNCESWIHSSVLHTQKVLQFYKETRLGVSLWFTEFLCVTRQTGLSSQDSEDPLWAEREARSRQIWSVTRGELLSSRVSPHVRRDTRGINEKMAKRVKFKLNTRCRVQTPWELQPQDTWRARLQCKFNLCVSMLISAGRRSNARHISLSLCSRITVDQSHPLFASLTVSPLFLLVTRLGRLSPSFTLSVKDEGHIWQLADGWCSVI